MVKPSLVFLSLKEKFQKSEFFVGTYQRKIPKIPKNKHLSFIYNFPVFFLISIFTDFLYLKTIDEIPGSRGGFEETP